MLQKSACYFNLSSFFHFSLQVSTCNDGSEVASPLRFKLNIKKTAFAVECGKIKFRANIII